MNENLFFFVGLVFLFVGVIMVVVVVEDTSIWRVFFDNDTMLSSEEEPFAVLVVVVVVVPFWYDSDGRWRFPDGEFAVVLREVVIAVFSSPFHDNGDDVDVDVGGGTNEISFFLWHSPGTSEGSQSLLDDDDDDDDDEDDDDDTGLLSWLVVRDILLLLWL